jgi:hypothetical protein
MASNVINRSIIRDDVYDLLSPALVGTGKPAQAIYKSLPSSFGGAATAVVVASKGSNRGKIANKADISKTVFDLDVLVYTMYGTGSTWTDDNMADAGDAIEKAIADVIIDNNVNETWMNLEYRGKSEIQRSVMVGSAEYQVELIPLSVEVINE